MITKYYEQLYIQIRQHRGNGPIPQNTQTTTTHKSPNIDFISPFPDFFPI